MEILLDSMKNFRFIYLKVFIQVFIQRIIVDLSIKEDDIMHGIMEDIKYDVEDDFGDNVDDKINVEILNGNKFPTDSHLAEEKQKWNAVKVKWVS